MSTSTSSELLELIKCFQQFQEHLFKKNSFILVRTERFLPNLPCSYPPLTSFTVSLGNNNLKTKIAVKTKSLTVTGGAKTVLALRKSSFQIFKNCFVCLADPWYVRSQGFSLCFLTQSVLNVKNPNSKAYIEICSKYLILQLPKAVTQVGSNRKADQKLKRKIWEMRWT